MLEMEQDIPTFGSQEEELRYWKDLAIQFHQDVEDAKEETRQVERELEEFQENSQQLEKELETQLEQSDKTIRELRTRNNRLQLDHDSMKESFEQTKRQNTTQISELQATVAEYQNHEKKLLEYIRELEQKNDDLERSHRAMMTSVGEFEQKLNSAIERNALLESEQDDSRALVQRLKDEARDLKQEMKIRKRELPDNDKCLERVRSPIDSNKLKVEMETQTAVPGSPLKSKLSFAYRRSKSFGLALNCMKSP
ncbi:Nuclear distribution protein nudE-like 1-A [Blattella germanica]|nr:Nuclear distribution protein nudE-like 1-A [Blattella germanica]